MNAWAYLSSGEKARARTAHALLLSASIILPLILLAIVVWQDRLSILEAAAQRVETTANVLEEHARNTFVMQELVAQAIDARTRAMSWNEIGRSRAVHEYLKSLQARYPQIQGLWLVDPAGKLRNASRVFPVPSVDLSDRDYYLALKEEDVGTYISRLVTGRVTEQNVFELAQRRNTDNGDFDGLVLISIAPESFVDFWRATLPSNDMFAELLRGERDILARAPSGPNGTIPSDSSLAMLMTQSDRGIFRSVSRFDGVDRLMAYRRVGSYNVFAVYGMGISAAFATWWRHLLAYGAFFGVMATALFLISLVAVRRAHQWSHASDQAAAESERRHEAEAHLLQAEKLEATGRLAGGLAHDFGNILAAVQLNLSSIDRRRVGTEVQPSIDVALTAVGEGQKVVRALLTFVRRHVAHTEAIDVGEAVSGAEFLIRHGLGARWSIVISLASDIWHVAADPTQLELAIINLCINARDAMPDGGTLRIEASNVPEATKPNDLIGDFVSISVADTGTGMSEVVAARAFEPFFTTKALGEGTGLGLSQVFNFATACGGTVVLDSVLGRGTTVTMYLPRAVSAGSEEASKPPGRSMPLAACLF